MTAIPTVEFVHWNPRRPVLPGKAGRFVPIRRRVNNFGDLLGPLIAQRLLAEYGLQNAPSAASSRLLTVGSVLHLSHAGDTVWGSGVNGKAIDIPADLGLDVRAVRGPRTQAVLQSAGYDVPTVFGDPGLLWARWWPRESYATTTTRRTTLIPNLHDWRRYRAFPGAVNPRADLDSVLRSIAESEVVIASSLHGIVIAESFGIPAVPIRSMTEPPFKYDDYYGGTGRPQVEFAATPEQALIMGPPPLPDWDPQSLLDAFPVDLWRPTSDPGSHS